MAVLVTGATGRLGASVVSTLLAGGETVAALVRSEEEMPFLPKGVEPRLGDITQKETLVAACRGIGCVYHLAALVDYAASDE